MCVCVCVCVPVYMQLLHRSLCVESTVHVHYKVCRCKEYTNRLCTVQLIPVVKRW